MWDFWGYWIFDAVLFLCSMTHVTLCIDSVSRDFVVLPFLCGLRFYIFFYSFLFRGFHSVGGSGNFDKFLWHWSGFMKYFRLYICENICFYYMTRFISDLLFQWPNAEWTCFNDQMSKFHSKLVQFVWHLKHVDLNKLLQPALFSYQSPCLVTLKRSMKFAKICTKTSDVHTWLDAVL